MTYFQLFTTTRKNQLPSESEDDLLLLIEHCFNLSPTKFWINKDQTISDQSGINTFHTLVRRLQEQEPLAYILGWKDFYKYRFRVNRDVLIPRPETEILVEQTLKAISRPVKIIEIGAGSGNISISLALESDSKFVAVEKSPSAFEVLRTNIDEHGVSNKVCPLNTDLFNGVRGKFDILISNPPYISGKDMDTLPLSVKNFEPDLALRGGDFGTEFIDKMIREAGQVLKPDGLLFIEIGYDQSRTVPKLLKQNGYRDIILFSDFNQIDRVVKATR